MYLTANFFDGFNEKFTEFSDRYFLKIAICIGVIALFFIIKVILTVVVSKIIKSAIKRSKNNEPERAEALKKAILPTVKIVVMTCALSVCLPILSPPEDIRNIIIKVIQSLFLIAAFSLLYGFASYSRYFLERRYREKGHNDDILAVNFIVTALKITVVVLGTLTVLQQWVSNISSLLAGLSIGGVALALAAQDTAANLFGAVTVMFDRPFDLGDFIEVAGEAGNVERMGMRSTTLRKKDRSVVCIPNSKMATENIVNWARTDSRRVDMALSVHYDTPRSTLEQFMDGIRQILEDEEGIKTENYLVAFDDFADSALMISIRYFTYSEDYDGMMDVKNSVNLRIMRLAENMKVSFAYPTRSVYLMKDEKN